MPPTDLTETTTDGPDEASAPEDGAPAGRRARGGTRKLVIVESPAKAKTIAGMLGPDYVVESSIGHIRDLATRKELPEAFKHESWADLAVDVDNGFKPVYIVSPEKKSQVTMLKRLARDAGEVYLATDEDREGESIAWHLSQVLGLPEDTPRMVFHEITPQAIQRAIEECRTIDPHLVEAQEARRIFDRIYGFKLSDVMRRKTNGRSAGRVQSVATRMVVDRERERMAFRSAGWWGIDATVTAEGEAARSAGADVSPSFAASLLAVDGTPLAGGKDFDSTGRLADPRRRGRARRGRGPGAGRRARGRAADRLVDDPQALPPVPPGAVHHLDAPAGGGPQAPLQLEAHHVGRPAPLRGGLDHLHADRLDDAVRAGPDRGPGPGLGHVRTGLRARRPPPLQQEGQERPGGARGHPPGGRDLPHTGRGRPVAVG